MSKSKRTKACSISPKVRQEVEEREEWREIKGYEDMYEVSNLGNVRKLKGYCFVTPNNTYRAYVYINGKKKGIGTYKSKADAKLARDEYIKTHNGVYWYQILKPNIVRQYLAVTLSKCGKSKNFYIHRLVAEAFIPNPNNLPVVNHINFNKFCNTVHNLEWCSCKYNVNYSSLRMCHPKNMAGNLKYIRKNKNSYSVDIRWKNFKYFKTYSNLATALEKRNEILKEFGYEI